MNTEGQIILGQLALKLTVSQIARLCRVSQPVVSRWIHGRRRPNYQNRKTLLARFNIGMEAWDRPAQGTQGVQGSQHTEGAEGAEGAVAKTRSAA
ncbi:Hypothetical protein CAP_2224 [Chondromyces apiculatus DSM 436]|uniref:HTH cro/C1-type domain-containing protein n=2 Tax=Chondromyces apiculatus TaxID=51 RepID=A0A017TA07_9BACT|nr:Hypothetical protein CAP_2224 [Chondromyces apiculatus DSM 436]